MPRRDGLAHLGGDPGDRARGVRRERLLHLHRLEDDEEVALDDLLALLDRELDDGGLHGRGDGSAARCVDGAGLLAPGRGRRRASGRGRARGGREVLGEAHLDALAADLDHDRVPGGRLGAVLEGAGPGLDGVVELGLDPARVDGEGRAVRRGEGRVAHDRAVEGEHGRQALHLELVEGAARALEGVLAAGSRDDELGEQRVERARDHVAGAHAGVDADAGAAGRLEHVHGAGRGEEAAARVLAVDAELERVATRRRVVVVDEAARGDAELLAHEVDARDLLGDRVLDLEAGVDLEEGDGAVLRHEELARAGADVADLAEDRLGRGVELGVLLVGEERRGRLLHELLVAALQRAVAGGDHDDGAGGVGQALRLDVARAVEVLLDEALAAAERRDGLAGGGLEELRHLLAGAGHLEAAAAAAERRLDRDGQAVYVDEAEHLVGAGHGVERAGGERRAHALGHVPGRGLVAELLDGARRGADPREPGVDDLLGEVGVLGEEAVARVHGVGAGAAGDGEELGDDEVGVGARLTVEGVGLVGERDVQGVAVLVGVDGDRADPRIPRRPDDADGDLAPVGDEDLVHTRHETPA